MSADELPTVVGEMMFTRNLYRTVTALDRAGCLLGGNEGRCSYLEELSMQMPPLPSLSLIRQVFSKDITISAFPE